MSQYKSQMTLGSCNLTSARVPDTSMTLSFGHRSTLSPSGTAFMFISMVIIVEDWCQRTVGHYQARQARLVDVLNGLAAEDTVRDNGKDLAGAVLVDGLGCLHKL